jgi:hypothetical protein
LVWCGAARHELAHRWHEHLLDALMLHDVAEAQGRCLSHLDIMEKNLLRRLPVSADEPGNEIR